MGTETRLNYVDKENKRRYEVKLNNPLMGTETDLYTYQSMYSIQIC